MYVFMHQLNPYILLKWSFKIVKDLLINILILALIKIVFTNNDNKTRIKI